MKNIILSRKDKELLEKVIIDHGRIVTFEQIKTVFQDVYTPAETKNRVSFLSKLGWFLRIKRGLYVVITDIATLDFNDISLHTIANILNSDSYISFENALQYHSMFDQMLVSVESVTDKRARRYKFKNSIIRFYRIKKELYFGFKEVKSDIGLVKIAEKEKALLDILHFRSDLYHAGLVWEKIREYKDMIDFNLLKEYAKKYGFDVIREIGFFLDRVEIDTADLLAIVKGRNSYSKMGKEAKQFDSKWRLYFDSRIIQ